MTMRASAVVACAALLCATSLPLRAQQVPAAYPRDSVTARLRELHRIATPERIDTLVQLDVDDSRQWVSIRGLNRANPVLFVLHGGPGSALLGSTWAYQKPWEDFFTVVNWDQRGVGKNFSPADSARLGDALGGARTSSCSRNRGASCSRWCATSCRWRVAAPTSSDGRSGRRRCAIC